MFTKNDFYEIGIMLNLYYGYDKISTIEIWEWNDIVWSLKGEVYIMKTVGGYLKY